MIHPSTYNTIPPTSATTASLAPSDNVFFGPQARTEPRALFFLCSRVSRITVSKMFLALAFTLERLAKLDLPLYILLM